MADYKVLDQVNPAANTDTTLFTATAETIVSTLFVANTGAATAKYRVAIRPGGASLATEHYISYGVSLPSGAADRDTSGITLASGDVITVRSDTADLAFTVCGVENP